MTVAEWLKSPARLNKVINVRPRAVCADGWSVSVQASEYAYCRPRVNDADSYDAVELGYPSAAEDALMPYAEDGDAPTETVYGFVPVEVVEQVVAAHGGIVGRGEARTWTS